MSQRLQITVSWDTLIEEYDWIGNQEIDLEESHFDNAKSLRVQFICREDRSHKWSSKTTLSSKNGLYSRSPCPYCAGKKLSPDKSNSAANVYPQLETQWDRSKNKRSMQETPFAYLTAISWHCISEDDHIWKESIKSRYDALESGVTCPICDGCGSNTPLEQSHNVIAQEWHNKLNGALKPSVVSEFSKIIVWWQCPEGHEWEKEIGKRVRGAICPRCKDTVYKVDFSRVANRISPVNKSLDLAYFLSMEILNGNLSPSDELPSETALTSLCNMSKMTVHSGMEILNNANIINRNPVGTKISPNIETILVGVREVVGKYISTAKWNHGQLDEEEIIRRSVREFADKHNLPTTRVGRVITEDKSLSQNGMVLDITPRLVNTIASLKMILDSNNEKISRIRWIQNDDKDTFEVETDDQHNSDGLHSFTKNTIEDLTRAVDEIDKCLFDNGMWYNCTEHDIDPP